MSLGFICLAFVLLGCGDDLAGRGGAKASAPKMGQVPAILTPPGAPAPPPSCLATQLLSRDQCVPACSVGQLVCEIQGVRTCVEAATDAENCGACGALCASTEECRAGNCEAVVSRSDECASSDDCDFGRSCLMFEGFTQCVHPTCSYQGIAQLGGIPHGSALEGDRLYVATGIDELYVYDVSVPAEAFEVGHLRLPGTQVRGIHVDGSLAVVWTSSELFMIDVADPSAPTLSGRIDVTVDAARLSGDGLYLLEDASLTIYDIENPTSPTRRGSYILPEGHFYQVEVRGNRAYLAHYNTSDRPTPGAEGGLHILNISNQDAPALVSHLPVDTARSLALRGDLLYLASKETLHTVDLVDENSPTIVHEVATHCYNSRLVVEGERLYSGSSCLEIWDLTDPRQPDYAISEDVRQYSNNWEGIQVAGDISFVQGYSTGIVVMNRADPDVLDVLRHINPLGNAGAIFFRNDVAYVAATGNLQVLDVSNPSKPSLLNSIPMSITDILMDGDHIYVTAEDGLHILATENEAEPVEVGFSASEKGLFSLTICGDFAYAANEARSAQQLMSIYDVSSPLNPFLLTQYELPANPIDIACDDDTVYVVNHDTFSIIDVTDKSHPVLRSKTKFSPYRHKIVVRGSNQVWVLGSKFDVYDVSDKTAPTLLTTVDELANTKGLAVENNIVYSATGAGLVVLDLTDIFHPRPLGRLDYNTDNNQGRGVALRDGFAFVSTSRQGLLVVDTSAYQNPTVLGQIKWDQSYSTNVVLDDHLAYVAGGASYQPGTFRTVDFSDPTSPTEIGSLEYATQNSLDEIEVRDGLAHLSKYDAYQILDVSDPAKPQALGTLDWPTRKSRNGLASSSDRAWVGINDALAAVDISNPTAPQFAQSILIAPYDSVELWGLRPNGKTHFGLARERSSSTIELIAFEISDASEMLLLGKLPFEVLPRAMAVDADETLAYLFGTNQLSIVDIRDLSAMKVLATVEFSGCSAQRHGIAVLRDRAYLSCQSAIAVVDVGNPFVPKYLYELHPPQGAGALDISDDGILVMTHSKGLTFLDPNACAFVD